jgi:hypothetical protein
LRGVFFGIAPLIAAIPVALLLTGCSSHENAARAEASCELDAKRFDATHQSATIRVGDMVELCMRAHGYELKLDKLCPIPPSVRKDLPILMLYRSTEDRQENPACYEASS